MKTKIDIHKIIEIAEQAGTEILKVYNQPDHQIEYKEDESPLTLADKKSHEVIKNRLEQISPEIPVLSEEGRQIPYSERSTWPVFWLVDPLDGTKEFIKRNGEFTVNIALIEDNQPVLGVIFAPVLNTIYFASEETGSYKQIIGETAERLPNAGQKQGVVAVQSRSHSSDDEQNVLKNYGVTDSISVGSSLKFCLVAEGTADIYYRHGPTMEWDVGAGHAVAKFAGCSVENLAYNKENLLNSSFLVKRF